MHENIAEPTDLVVDPNSHMIYWTDAKLDGKLKFNLLYFFFFSLLIKKQNF